MSEASSAATTRSPIRVCLLGSEGTGKTCFLAGLSVLAEPDRDSPVSVTHGDAVTASYFDDLRRTLRQRQWPPPTTMTTLLTTRVTIDSTNMEIKFIDYPGEDFRTALRKLERERIEELYAHYQHADALLLLFDPERDLREATDPRERDLQLERLSAHLQAIAEIGGERLEQGNREARKIDVAVVVTKCDSVLELVHPGSVKKFFRRRAPHLDRRIRESADEVSYFALSAVGNCQPRGESGELIPGEELSPTGYLDVFEWVRLRRWWRRNGPVVGIAVLATALVMVGMVAWWFWTTTTKKQALAALDDSLIPTTQLLKQYGKNQDDEIRGALSDRVRPEIERLRNGVEQAATENELAASIEELTGLRMNCPQHLQAELEQVLRDARRRQEDFAYDRVRMMREDRDPEFVEAAHRFLREYDPSEPRAKELRKWIRADREERMQAARQRIRQMRVTNVAGLQSKSQAVFDFLEEFGDDLRDAERERMRRAAELAKRFGEENSYEVRLKRSGGFTDARKQGVQVFASGTRVLNYESSDASKDVTWTDANARFQWSAGQAIEIRLRGKPWGWFRGLQDVATLSDSSPVALRVLGARKVLSTFFDDWQGYCDEAFVQLEVDGITAGDWQAVERYILPGGAW